MLSDAFPHFRIFLSLTKLREELQALRKLATSMIW